MFGGLVRDYEKEFSTENLENKHVFYDLYLKTDDAQDLRNEVSESLSDLGYKTLLNEMTKFDDPGMEELFRGGNAKPIRVYLKSAKDNYKGSKYPVLWKTFLVVGVILTIVAVMISGSSVYNQIKTLSYSPPTLFIYATIACYALAVIFLAVRFTVPMFSWIKIIGVYDPTEASSNVRVVLAAECQFADKDTYAKLESDMSELYSELSRKYSNKLKKSDFNDSVTSGLSIGRGANQKLLLRLKEAEKESADLERNFTAGKISENKYDELKASIDGKKAQLEALFDLLAP